MLDDTCAYTYPARASMSGISPTFTFWFTNNTLSSHSLLPSEGSDMRFRDCHGDLVIEGINLTTFGHIYRYVQTFGDRG